VRIKATTTTVSIFTFLLATGVTLQLYQWIHWRLHPLDNPRPTPDGIRSQFAQFPFAQQTVVDQGFDKSASAGMSGYFVGQLSPSEVVAVFKKDLIMQGWTVRKEKKGSTAYVSLCRDSIFAAITSEPVGNGDIKTRVSVSWTYYTQASSYCGR
jgi:hypothetical protein